MNSLEKLNKKNNEGKFICVGLDTDIKKIPVFLLKEKDPILSFNKLIIESTYKYAAAYKINFAFYEDSGSEGFRKLKETLSLIPEDVLTIGDAKRGDIGNTSEKYAQAIFEHFAFDASTLAPYMGYDSISPFLKYKDKMNFILALTSNPGSSDFQKLQLQNGEYLFQHVIRTVDSWNHEKNCGIVFGATQAVELESNMNIIKDLPVLIPGVGAQGGDLNEIVRIFKQEGRKNYLVNISRGILYKDNSINFNKIAEEEINNLNMVIASQL